MKFSIRKKFFLIASIGLIAILLMLFLTRKITTDSFSDLQNIFENSKKVEHLERNVKGPLFHLREISLSLVTAPNEDFRKEIRKDVPTLIKGLDSNFANLDSDIQKLWKNYKKLLFLTDKYIKQDFEEGAFNNVNSIEREQFYIIISKLDELQKRELANSQKSFNGVKKSFADFEKLSYFIAIAVIFLSFLFYFAIANGIVSSIDTLKNGLRKFFDLLGRKIDMDEDITIKINHNDELKLMADMINENVQIVRDRLKKDIELIKNATNVISELRLGHLNRRFDADEGSSEIGELKNMLNQMLDNLAQRVNEEIEQKTQKEKLLAHQSRFATMGEMIGNIAHQWRQPLSEVSAIMMRMQVEREHDDLDDERFEKYIQECEKILSHMSQTISDFQNFFQPSKKRVLFSIKDTCSEASDIISSSLKYNNIDFKIDIEDDVKVLGYPREFAQVILNLLSNAKDVIVERKTKNAFIKLKIKSGKKYSLVTVEDNAGGVKKENLERIFEPYFTTKHAKQGTGIGLYMCKNIIEENMNGYLNVKNTETGALFTIKLSL